MNMRQTKYNLIHKRDVFKVLKILLHVVYRKKQFVYPKLLL